MSDMAGRQFSFEEIEKFESAIRLKDNIGETSWPIFRVGLTRYCNYVRMDPDQIIADRNTTYKNDELKVKRKHEDIYTAFMGYLKMLKTRQQTPLSPSSQASSLIAVKSFYQKNFVALVEPKKMSGIHTIRIQHMPTPVELENILSNITHPVYKAITLAESQSGISIGDLLALRWDKQSDTFGTIRTQVTEGIMVDGVKRDMVHIHSVRQKTNTTFDSWFGAKTVEALRVKNYPKSERVFPVSIGEVDGAIKEAAKTCGLNGDVTSNVLRKFFTTNLKLANLNGDLVEYWCGHKLQGARGQYLIPPVERQASIYFVYERFITPTSNGVTVIPQPLSEAQLAQGPVVVHELSSTQIAPVPSPISVPVPVAQPVMISSVAKSTPAPTAPMPVVSTPPPKVVIKIADLLKRLEKKQQ